MDSPRSSFVTFFRTALRIVLYFSSMASCWALSLRSRSALCQVDCLRVNKHAVDIDLDHAAVLCDPFQQTVRYISRYVADRAR